MHWEPEKYPQPLPYLGFSCCVARHLSIMLQALLRPAITATWSIVVRRTVRWKSTRKSLQRTKCAVPRVLSKKDCDPRMLRLRFVGRSVSLHLSSGQSACFLHELFHSVYWVLHVLFGIFVQQTYGLYPKGMHFLLRETNSSRDGSVGISSKTADSFLPDHF